MRFWPFKRSLKVIVAYRDPLKLRLHEWRADRALVSKAMQLLNSPDFRLMLDVLRNERPVNAMLPDACPIEIRAMFQAREEGYHIALSNLEALAKFEAISEPVEATFEPEQVP